MTNHENTLPTAAKVTRVGGTPQERAAIKNYVRITKGDKLVRRKDVEKLIQHKKDQFNEGRPPEYPQKALKEVLDEVRNQ